MTLDTKELRRLLAEASAPITGRKCFAEADYARALHNAAPALIGAAEEVERLQAGVAHPMWLPSVADALGADDPFQATADGVLEAARAVAAEVERLRAFVPVWRMKRYSPSAVTWRLFIGTTAIPDTGLHPIGDGRVFASGDGEGHPDLPTAARAVCDALGVPYVAVTEP